MQNVKTKGKDKEININIDLERLWNDDDTERFNNETYHHLLMEQYKIYFNISDNINARRTVINTFFLTLHAIILAVIGLSLSRMPSVPNLVLLLITLMGLLGLCFSWWKLARYYRQVARAKRQVISELEKRLPSNASVTADRQLGNTKRNPLFSIETTLPIIFATLYLLSYAYVSYLSDMRFSLL
tara:strand:- start:2 stop:556 length:555 start_codon:yes stop_codon:yes gene_type:complete